VYYLIALLKEVIAAAEFTSITCLKRLEIYFNLKLIGIGLSATEFFHTVSFYDAIPPTKEEDLFLTS
jgi:hypothetical protein